MPMPRLLQCTLAFMLLSGILAAQEQATASPAPEAQSSPSYLTPGLQAWTDARAAQPAAPLGQEDFLQLASLLSQEEQARQFVDSVYVHAFVFGGSGHFAQGEYVYGSLFAALDAGVIAGMLMGANALLPKAVQAGSMDYFSTSGADMESAWKALSLGDILPSLSVLAGATILRGFILNFEADHARTLAKESIQNGKLVFEPKPWLALGGSGGFCLGLSLSN